MNEKYRFPYDTSYSDASLSKIDFNPETNLRLSNWMADPKDILLFIGNPGIGKTYFCAALMNYFKEKNEENKFIYKNEREFLSQIRSVISEPGGDYTYEVKKMARYPKIWIIDDLGSSQGTAWQKEVLTTFLDESRLSRKPIVLTTNIWSRDLDHSFDFRIKSRLLSAQNVVIEVNGEDKRQLGM